MGLYSMVAATVIVLGVWFLSGGGVMAADGELQESAQIPLLWYLAPAAAIIALLVAFLFYRNMKKESEGTDSMKAIASAVREGANAYLKRQYKVVAIFLVALAAILAYLAFGLAVPVMAFTGMVTSAGVLMRISSRE